MAQNDTKYILVDWDERESYVFTKDELVGHLHLVMSQSGYEMRENTSMNTEDLEVEIYKVTKSQLPKRIVLEINVKIEWKELT